MVTPGDWVSVPKFSEGSNPLQNNHLVWIVIAYYNIDKVWIKDALDMIC